MTTVITLPLGLTHDGVVYREAEVSPMTGGTLKALRQTLSQSRRPRDLGHVLIVLQAGLKRIVGLNESVTSSLLHKLYWADAEYILHTMAALESESLDEKPRLRRRCPDCDKDQTLEVDLAGRGCVTRDTLSPKFDTDLTVPFHLKTPITSLDSQGTPYDEGALAPITVADYLDISRVAFDNIGSGTFFHLCRAIVRLGPKGKGEFDVSDLNAMSAGELKRLERLYNEVEPGLKPLGTAPCPDCGATISLDPVEYVTDFLLVSF